MGLAVSILWIAFGLYWLVSAIGVKRGSRGWKNRPPVYLVIVGVVLLRSYKPGSLATHGAALHAVGATLLVSGLAVSVWARIFLGRNWGMPMTRKEEPELITSGPYRYVRHPIYSGILLALVGTALATNLYWLIVLGVMGPYFIHSARVEERLMIATFPTAYRSYRANTKMLVPFLL
jgi:protein-S-isoprenylcysteine O-methyltransferase Ste14